MRSEESQQGLIASLVLLADLGIFEIRPRSHPSVDHVGVGLDKLWYRQIVRICLDSCRIFIFARQQSHGNANFLRLLRIHKRGMHLCRSFECLLTVLTACQTCDLCSPAISQNAPLKRAGRRELVRFLYDGRDSRNSFRRGSFGRKEVAQILLLFICFWWNDGNVTRLAFEEVRNEDAVLVVSVGSGQDIGPLEGLWEKSEDIYEETT